MKQFEIVNFINNRILKRWNNLQVQLIVAPFLAKTIIYYCKKY